MFKQLNIVDPEAIAELHLKLREKYIGEAEELLEGKDYLHASEKAWNAASQMVKATTSKEGNGLRSHASL